MTLIKRQAVYAEHLIKNSLDFIGAADENGEIVEYNPAALRAFGYTMEEMLELDLVELYASKDDFERVVKALSEDGEFKGEVRNKRKNGEEFTCFLSANVLIDDQGQNVGIMGVSRDISHEKELAKQLEIQNEKNTKLIDELISLSRIATKVSNGIVITDPEGRMKWCNDSFSRITGYTNNELIGHKPSELFRVPHFFKDDFKQLTEDTHGATNSLQVAHYHKGGSLYWILVESTPVYDDEGKLSEIIEICTEITDQKKAEIALIESEANFRQMSETIEDVFFLYNASSKQYEYMSPNSVDMLGVAPDFFYTGKAYLNKFVHENDRHLIRKGRLDLMNRIPYDVEYRVEVDSEIKWMRERAFPVIDEDGDVIKGSGVISDITQLKQDRKLIDLQNQDIAESISYAQHIQRSTLQDEEDIKRVFENSFLYFMPKDELSGDFYIMDHVVTNNLEKLPVFIVADCTGHGVPGAILSILCLSLMTQTFGDREINSPAEALDGVRSQLAKLFHSGESLQINDGMDVGIGVLYEEKKQLVYSGANINAFIFRNGSWIELRGSKQHVGYSEKTTPFKNVVIDYQSGDQLYLFTDGFVDQFGGEKNKKYMKRRLMDFIASIAHEPMEDQRAMINIEFLTWKGTEEQTDDICCFGFKFD
jgi:PAS domain S-box-containing protein